MSRAVLENGHIILNSPLKVIVTIVFVLFLITFDRNDCKHFNFSTIIVFHNDWPTQRDVRLFLCSAPGAPSMIDSKDSSIIHKNWYLYKYMTQVTVKTGTKMTVWGRNKERSMSLLMIKLRRIYAIRLWCTGIPGVKETDVVGGCDILMIKYGKTSVSFSEGFIAHT